VPPLLDADTLPGNPFRFFVNSRPIFLLTRTDASYPPFLYVLLLLCVSLTKVAFPIPRHWVSTAAARISPTSAPPGGDSILKFPPCPFPPPRLANYSLGGGGVRFLQTNTNSAATNVPRGFYFCRSSLETFVQEVGPR